MNKTIHPKYGFPFPLYLTCKVSGKVFKRTNVEWIKKKLETTTWQELVANFVSREAKGQTSSSTPVTTPSETKSTTCIAKKAVNKPSNRTWKGGSIDNTLVENSAPAEYIERQYIVTTNHPDIGECDVICTTRTPRQNKEQIPFLKTDRRKKRHGEKLV